jgi:hypothetical protein
MQIEKHEVRRTSIMRDALLGAAEATETPIACSLSDPELARRAAELERELFSAVEEVAELPDGYAYRFPADRQSIEKLVAFIAFERECCPFFTFELSFLPNQGPVWLQLRGSQEIEEFVSSLHGSISVAVTNRSG